MTAHKNSARSVASRIIEEWLATSKPVDQIRDRFLSNVLLDSRDKALVTEIVYGVVRNHLHLVSTIDAVSRKPVSKMQYSLQAILFAAIYQLLNLDRVPAHAIINDAVSEVRKRVNQKAAGFVNAVLRKLDSMQIEHVSSSPVPEVWYNKWVSQWGEEKTSELVAYINSKPLIGLRLNQLTGIKEEQWHMMLKAEDVKFQMVDDFPGYIYTKAVHPPDLKMFEQGVITVQDPAAGMAVRLLDPKPGEVIADFCSAPGGKTAYIFELMGGDGKLFSVDRSEKRQGLTSENLKRLGHHGIEVISTDVLNYDGQLFDRILLDVPCSGTGVSRRRPDLLNKRHPDSLKELTELQWKLIIHSSKLVKPGGCLVYSTCSLEPEENELLALRFEREFGNSFKRAQISPDLQSKWLTADGFYATWPARDKVDGMFAAKWIRII